MKNIIKSITRRAEEGLIVRYGSGSTAEDIWYEEEHLFGEAVKDKMNYSDYVTELKSRYRKQNDGGIMGERMETKMKDHDITQFPGGSDRGVCVQISSSKDIRVCETLLEQIQEEGFIQLTMEEASALQNDLCRFVKEEASRRIELLRKQIGDLKEIEKTVFKEILALPVDDMGQDLIVDMVSRFCPKHGGR